MDLGEIYHYRISEVRIILVDLNNSENWGDMN